MEKTYNLLSATQIQLRIKLDDVRLLRIYSFSCYLSIEFEV